MVLQSFRAVLHRRKGHERFAARSLLIVLSDHDHQLVLRIVRHDQRREERRDFLLCRLFINVYESFHGVWQSAKLQRRDSILYDSLLQHCLLQQIARLHARLSMLRSTSVSLFPRFFASRNELRAVRIQRRSRVDRFLARQLREVKSFAQTAIHHGLQLAGCEGSVERRDFAEREVVQRVRFGERKRVLRGREIAERERRGGIRVLEEERGRRVYDAHRIGAATLCREVLEQASGSNGRTQRAFLRIPAMQRLATHFGPTGIGELEGACGDRGGGNGGEDGGVVERREVGGPLRGSEVVSGIGSRIEEGIGMKERRVGVERRLVPAKERVGCVH